MNITVIRYDSHSYFWCDQLVRIGINMWHPDYKRTHHSIGWDWDDNKIVLGRLRKEIVLE